MEKKGGYAAGRCMTAGEGVRRRMQKRVEEEGIKITFWINWPMRTA